MSSLNIERLAQTPPRFVLKGTIDDGADLSPLEGDALNDARDGAAHIELDLSGIERINSVGVSRWIRVTRTWEAAGVAVVWLDVSAAMATQLTMIANFSGNAAVESYYAPYYCPACDSEHDVRFVAAQTPDIPPAPACPSCAAAMTFDDVAEGWFKTLAGLAPP